MSVDVLKNNKNESSSYIPKNCLSNLKEVKEATISHPPCPKEKNVIQIKSILNKSNIKIVSNIISFLEFKDIIQFQNTNKYFHKLLTNKKILREYALSGVMSSENRLLFYETIINVKELKLNLRNELLKYNIKSKIYNNILLLANNLKDKDEKFSYVIEQIGKDVNRTFYTEKFKEGNGKEILKNILTAIAFIRPEIGYCQGMNFIAGALINFIDNEEKCFWIFLHFIDNIELKMLYIQNMPVYLIKLYQLNYYIKENFPKLLPHLKKNQVNPDIFFSKWILTAFSNFLPFETLYNVWDLFIIDKWKAIFKFSIIILSYMKDKLMNLDLYSFSPYVRNNANINELNFYDLSKYYNNYKISNKKLEELKEDFYIEDLKSKLEINKSGINQNYHINNYQSELNHFIYNLKKPVEKLQQQIANINLECEKKLKKYEEKLSLVKELKMKLEEEIELKTKYENTLKQLEGQDRNNQNLIDNIHLITNQGKKDKLKELSPINKTFKKSETQKIKGSVGSKKKKIRFSFNIKHIIKRNSNEYEYILKKLNSLNKEIDKNNKALLIECQKLDRKQINYDKVVYKKNELKKQLDIILNTSEVVKRELIKNLSNKLNSTSNN